MPKPAPQRRNDATRKDANRTQVANGTRLLPGVDGRSVWVRRCRELLRDHVADLGGEANVSTAERSIVRRAAVLTTELEQLEVKFALAGAASADDIDLYARVAAHLRRLLESVGLGRRPKDVSTPVPNLQTYLRQRTHVDEAVEAEQ
jgi:hypothetical protein